MEGGCTGLHATRVVGGMMHGASVARRRNAHPLARLPIAILLVVNGCASSPGNLIASLTPHGRLLQDGPAAAMNSEAIVADRERSVQYLYQFALQAGVVQMQSGVAPAVDAEQGALSAVAADRWPIIVQVGEGYIDGRCQAYLGAIYQLEKSRKATLADLNAIQSATVGIMGLALAAKQSIGVVGLAFGLASSLFDTSVSEFLYQLPSSSIQSIVEAQRLILRQGEPDILGSLVNQGLSTGRLASYLQYCAPLNIETNIEKVLQNTRAGTGAAAGSIVTDATAPSISAYTAVRHDAAEAKLRPTVEDLAIQVSGLNDAAALRLAAALDGELRATPSRVQAQLSAFGAPGALRSGSQAKRYVSQWLVLNGSLTAGDLDKIRSALRTSNEGGPK